MPVSTVAADLLRRNPALLGNLKTFRREWSSGGDVAYLTRLLAKHDRMIDRVAAEAGVDRTYIYRLMRKYNL